MVKEYIAYCGLKCGECPIFIATATGDEKMKEQLAWEYSVPGCEFERADMNCEGCFSEGAKSSRMCAGCGIRVCAAGRGVETCADCEEYPCAVVEGYLPKDSENRQFLNELSRMKKEGLTGI